MIVAVAFIGLAQATTQATDFGLQLHVPALDANLHSSIFGVASLLAQAAAALAATAYALTGRRPIAWLILAALVGALLVFRISTAYDASLLIVPTGLVFGLYWWLASARSQDSRTLIRAGLVLLAFSFVVHAVGATLVTTLGGDANGWGWQIKGILKHSTELMGWTLLAVGAFPIAEWTRRRAAVGDGDRRRQRGGGRVVADSIGIAPPAE